LGGPEGNVFIAIGYARAKLTGLMLEHFNREIGRATLIALNTRYEDILRIVNTYVRLVDRSGLYTNYAMNHDEVLAAIEHLNEQLQTLPDDVPCSLEGLYPDFDEPDMNEYVYLTMLLAEIQSTEQDIELVGDEKAEPLRQLLAMLRECASALERAGIG
jgi:hypothetical protein